MANRRTPGVVPDIYPLEVPSGCLLYFDMQEGGGTIIDHSGNGRNGTNDGSTVAVGPSGLVRSFDGSNDKIDVSGAPVMTGLPLSIEAWVKPNEAASVILGIPITTGALGVYGGIGANGSLVYVINRVTTDLLVASQASDITWSAWNHVVIADDASLTAANMGLYVNGTLRSHASNVQGVGGQIGLGTDWIIGARDSGYGLPFGGQMGLLRVYDRVLTAAEVLANYRQDAWRYGLPG